MLLGSVIVQPAEVGPVPTLMSKAAVPARLLIVAPEPPQPPVAIVGDVAEIKFRPLTANALVALTCPIDHRPLQVT